MNIELINNAVSTKGDISLYFSVIDSETGVSLNLLSHKMAIKFTDELVEFLADNENIVTYTLNNGQWKTRRKVEEKPTDADTFANDEWSPEQMENDDD